MSTAVVAGSFDPITLGHVYVIEQALKAVDHVYVAIALNAAKKGTFTVEEKNSLINTSILEVLGGDALKRTSVIILPGKKFVAKHARELGSSFIFRGIRNVVDFEYEHSQQLINNKVAPEVTTVFVMPPMNLTAVSSSAMKAMVGLEGWEDIVGEFVAPSVVKALGAKAQ